MKKISMLVTLIIMVVISFSLYGCDSLSKNVGEVDLKTDKGQLSSDLQSKSLPKKLDNPDIIAMVWTENVKENYGEAAKLFEERYGGKVSYVMAPLNQFEQKLIVSMSAGDSPDVTYWQESNMPTYAIKGLIQPVDPYFDFIETSFVDNISSMDQFKYKGKYYGISEGANPYVLYYNKTMFENNGAKTPLDYWKEGKWTWVSLRETAMALTQDTDRDGVIDQWGFYANTHHLISANGADMVSINDDGKIELSITDQKVIEVIQFYQDALLKDKFMSTRSPVNQQKDFVEGKLAMFAGKTALLQNTLPDMKYECDVAPIPAGPSGESGVSPAHCGFTAIASGSKNPHGAAAFIYLKFRTRDSFEDKKDFSTPEQFERLKEMRKKVNMPKYTGIGKLNNILNSGLWQPLQKGQMLSTVVEQITPMLQAEIDVVMKDAK